MLRILGDEDTFDGPSSVEAEANSSDGGFDDLDMPDPQELSNTGGNSNDGDRQVRLCLASSERNP